MPDSPTIGEATGYTLYVLGDILFKWVPGMVASMTGVTPASFTGTTPPAMPVITEPVSFPHTVDFLQTYTAPGVYDKLYEYWTDWVIISLILSLLFATSIIYTLTRIVQIRRAEYRHFEAMQHSVIAGDVPRTHLRWKRVEEQAHSDSEQAWRLAILEADIMLNELLDLQGYRGETMSDKLRSVEKSKFNTIELAWEAHRMRNRVAHEGAAHQLSGRETLRIIGLYEKVFQEFKFIE